MSIQKGDVFLCTLDPTFGHEQRGRRPVVVLQNDIANDKLNTVMVAPLTSNLKARGYLLTVFVEAASIKRWYNGFCFSRRCTQVYNPYSLLRLFQENLFSNYWFANEQKQVPPEPMQQQEQDNTPGIIVTSEPESRSPVTDSCGSACSTSRTLI